jgi:hypothetical protein
VAGLEKRGVVRTGSCRVFARSRVGVAVRAGAPKPDISSVAALRRALLDARSIAHTVHGASGMYVPELLERLGIAGEVKHKIVTRPGGYIGGVVASGDAEIAVQQIVELLAVRASISSVRCRTKCSRCSIPRPGSSRPHGNQRRPMGSSASCSIRRTAARSRRSGWSREGSLETRNS